MYGVSFFTLDYSVLLKSATNKFSLQRGLIFTKKNKKPVTSAEPAVWTGIWYSNIQLNCFYLLTDHPLHFEQYSIQNKAEKLKP